MAGLTPQGFSIYSQEDLVGIVGGLIINAFGASIDISAGSGMGQLITIVCERFAELWQGLQTLYSSMTADGATGVRLDDVAALTGTIRQAATSSTDTATLTGVPATVVATGSQAKTLSTSIVFQSLVDATIAAVAAYVTGTPTAYVAPTRVTNAGNVYQCTTSGVTAGSTGPTSTASAISDNTVVWKFLGQGTGAIDVDMAAVLTGPLLAAAGDLTVRVSAVFGWLGVINLADATPGANQMSDEDLRVLRESELAEPGDETVDAIRADILDLPGVISCTVFNNVGDTIDGDGRPPHSVEALVLGGDNQAIFDQLLSSVAAGIQTVGIGAGAQTGTSVDSEGISHTMMFTRPDEITISTYSTVVFDAELYPSDGDEEIQLAIVAFGDEQKTGKDAVPSSINAQAFTVPGVDDSSTLVFGDTIAAPAAWIAAHAYVATVGSRSVVTNDGGRAYICVQSGTSAGSGGPSGVASAVIDPSTGAYVSGGITDGAAIWSFLGATIPISTRQLATFSTLRCTVSSSSGTP